eukprot:79887-Rhodomonas_salina.2
MKRIEEYYLGFNSRHTIAVRPECCTTPVRSFRNSTVTYPSHAPKRSFLGKFVAPNTSSSISMYDRDCPGSATCSTALSAAAFTAGSGSTERGLSTGHALPDIST